MKSPEEIKSMKGKEKIAVLTAYDYNLGQIFDEVGIDIILVGDSMGNVVLGYETTRDVTMQDIISHTEAVARGCKDSLIVADLPYLSDRNEEEAVKNAKLLVMAGADAVKPEGKPAIVKALVNAGIPVMGHVGLLPQTADKMKLIGKEKEEAENVISLAKQLEEAGAFCIVVEAVPNELAKEITSVLKIPTIGIGAGPYCDGQVLVSYDMLGLYEKSPSFVKKYADLRPIIKKAATSYKEEVKEGKFPT